MTNCQRHQRNRSALSASLSYRYVPAEDPMERVGYWIGVAVGVFLVPAVFINGFAGRGHRFLKLDCPTAPPASPKRPAEMKAVSLIG